MVRPSGAGRVEASIHHGQWSSDDAVLLERLKVLRLETDQYYPDRDYALAHLAIDLYGGEIISAPPVPEATDDDGKVY